MAKHAHTDACYWITYVTSSLSVTWLCVDEFMGAAADPLTVGCIFCPDDEGRKWLRGHHTAESKEARALVTAAAALLAEPTTTIGMTGAAWPRYTLPLSNNGAK